VLRKGNNPPTTDSAPTWAANRTIYTTGSAFATGMIALTDSATLDAGQKSWVRGLDVGNTLGMDQEVSGLTTSQTRASLHGDVVHSRPLPVTYGSNDGVIYYGANDGMFRAVDAESGNELWALMPFEFAQTSFVDRLRNNTP
jgi:type IV pilus assembly protein PilY1